MWETKRKCGFTSTGGGAEKHATSVSGAYGNEFGRFEITRKGRSASTSPNSHLRQPGSARPLRSSKTATKGKGENSKLLCKATEERKNYGVWFNCTYEQRGILNVR